jgi:hypothetical protein
MDADQKKYQTLYGILMIGVAVAMIGWAVPYGFANYQSDSCNENLQTRIDAIKARLDNPAGSEQRK